MLQYIAQIMSLSEEEVINHPVYLINAFDQDHRVLFWNKKCEQYFSVSLAEALNEIFEDLIPESRNNPKMRLLDEAFTGKTIFVTEEKYDRKNGLYSQIVIPLKNELGKVVAAVNIVSDMPQPFNRKKVQRPELANFN